MEISNVYVGGWFQRTMLQLSEIYDFLRDCKTQLKQLDENKLNEFRRSLEIGKIDYGVAGVEYIEFTTALNIKVKIFEDGLIMLNNENVSENTLFHDIDVVTDYYENKLSPAFNYLFSLGAPVPKELAHIETVYPYFIVCNNSSKEEINMLLSRTEKQKYFEFTNDKYDVIRGDKYYFINNKKQTLGNIERYIEEQIFIREYKGQLHRYLNLHRIIWEKIDEVKERANVKGADIVKFNTKLEGYAKTINLIDGRINQMSTYLPTREKIAKSDKELSEFLSISGYRYETLKDTLDYIKHLWSMTKNYVTSAQRLFNDLQASVTNKSIGSLTIVTSMGVGASLIDLFTESAPSFSAFGFVYFFALAIIGYVVNKLMNVIARSRKYEVNDIEYDKDIK
ncbi:MAG: hypothetical protein J6B73_01095 [Methanobrevibacter sp.]|uniref:hypothetical protein n=1 Tax=Methanobrevibacter sp. TaxID=66852 RepID=UPI001B10A11F|nr:hypothetical protein [Methanobrevibacter sp.]MBO5150750.1 hypothetical protein [Methanobrevibacter sp.]